MFIKLRIYLHIILGLVVGRHALENLALNKPAEMSTRRTTDSGADGAVDGNTAQTIGSASCALTALDKAPEAWWRVDLNGTFAISELKIYLLDSEIYRFRHYSVHFTDELTNWRSSPYCTKDHSDANGPSSSVVILNCDGKGRYLTIWLNREIDCRPQDNINQCDILQLCEVQVLGRIRVCNNKFPAKDHSDADGPSLSVVRLNCDGKGRYLTIWLNRAVDCTPKDRINQCDILQLCEVQVLGCYPGNYSQNCNMTCPVNCRDDICNIDGGQCFQCKDGYLGNTCDNECETGKFGRQCLQVCKGKCRGGQTCSHINGYCPNGCTDGYIGTYCNKTCSHGLFGFNCTQECGNCLNNKTCLHTNGTCDNGCASGWNGSYCNTNCDAGRYGVNCRNTCSVHCRDSSGCDIFTGTCTGGCKDGWTGRLCDKSCITGTFGYGCNETCGHCLENDNCSNYNGTCPRGCQSGRTGDTCKEWCPDETYGFQCEGICSSTCNTTCNKTTGQCDTGCTGGWTGLYCNKSCDQGTYGPGCIYNCSGNCIGNDSCSIVDGSCPDGCDEGWRADICHKNTDLFVQIPHTSDATTAIAAGVGSTVVVIIVVIVVVVLVVRMRRKSKNAERRFSKRMSTYLTEDSDNQPGPSAVYAEVDKSNKTTKPKKSIALGPSALYADVDKSNEMPRPKKSIAPGPSALFAEVDKSKKTPRPNKNITPGPSDLYAEVDKSSKSPKSGLHGGYVVQRGPLYEDVDTTSDKKKKKKPTKQNGPDRNVNPQGLVYVDVEFPNATQNKTRPIDSEERTEYASLQMQ